MYKLILVLTVAFAVGNGSEVTTSERIGGVTLYYYSSGQRNPILINQAHIPSGVTPIAPFNNDWSIVVIIHGHGGTGFTTINPLVKDAFLSTGNYNVVVVDWSSISLFSYELAMMFVPTVGADVGNLLRSLQLPKNKIHIIGFGLGAHVAGYAGRVVGGEIARITALDPAARGWENNPMRLNTHDAQYVEVIHTDGTGPDSNGLGIPMGHMDFYVNGRSLQPGCTTNLCNHNRAYEVFAASITHPGHFGSQCRSDYEVISDSCIGFLVEMGTANLRKFGLGIFRLTTGMTYPYHNDL